MLSETELAGGRVLIVEDDADIADVLRRSLRNEGYEVRTSADGYDALEVAAGFVPDLVVLDLGLPGLDGVEVCKRLRTDGDVPILMLTARAETEDRVAGLDSGADDYLAKPFEMPELLARTRALRRRTSTDRTPVIAVHDLRLDPAKLGVTRGGRSIRLTAREFALLELLARYPGQIFPQSRLIESLWDADFAAESNVVEVYIRSLRRKIDGGRRDGLIETVRGSGYRLRAEEA
ncbi:MAG TPA: response regulator transcription factor [Solirubrobacterales bacterium]